MPERQRFPGLSSTAFEHPTDKAALAVLRKAPGLAGRILSARCFLIRLPIFG